MKVCEMFLSIQGEGPEIGHPTLFIRLSGCNLRCPFCDSKYSYDGGDKFSINRVVKEIKKFKITHITWTGGEPALQYNEIKEVVRQLGYEYKHSIETNGTILFNPWPFNTVVVSPKQELIKPEVIRWLFSYTDKTYLKFVVRNDKEFAFWWDFIEDERLNQKKEKIYFMPEGIYNDELWKTSLWLVEKCKKYQVNYSPRIQNWLWSNARGK